jgi:nucleoside-diphosphate-sugar epimerase
VYNVGGGSGASVNEALELIAALAGRPLDVRYIDRELGDVRDTGADISRAETELGYQPRTSLAEGLQAELEWMLEREAAAAPRARVAAT